MYKILRNIEKIETEQKKKGKKKSKSIEVKEDIRFIDLDRRFSGHPINSYDVLVSASICKDEENPGLYKGMRNDFLGFMDNEMKMAEELKKKIDSLGISRSRIHKMLGCSSETLRKLEEDPLSLDDRCKRYLRRKINGVLNGGV